MSRRPSQPSGPTGPQPSRPKEAPRPDPPTRSQSMTREEYIREVVDQAPPLSAHQVHVLRAHLGPALHAKTRINAEKKAAEISAA